MDETGPAHSWLPSFMRKPKSPKGSSDDTPPNEISTLLPKGTKDSGEDPENGKIYELLDPLTKSKSGWRVVLDEFRILTKGSIPVILAYTLQNSLQTISVVIVGRGSPEDLATAAFSYMFAMSTAWLIGLGGTTALDTLCSSAFTGSHDPHDLGVLLQRAFITLGGFYVPVAVLWFFSEPVFKALGQGDQLSHDSARFLWCLIPGGLGYIYFECMKKYLQAQGRFSLGSGLLLYAANLPRNHATRNLCFIDHLTNKRWPQFPFRLHIQNGPARSASSNRRLLLAIFSSPTCIRTLCQRLGVLGRMVAKMPAPHGNFCPACNSRSHPCWHGMVGI